MNKKIKLELVVIVTLKKTFISHSYLKIILFNLEK